MSSIPIIGHGYWGKIIESKLKKLNKPIKIITKDKYNDFLNNKSEIYEHIIISTQTDTHVNIINDLINNLSLNETLIFCEKPFTKNISSFSLLNDYKVYISDVFLYNNKYLNIKSFCKDKKIKEISVETYNNSVSQKETILYDLMYHDLYMLMNLINNFSITNIIIYSYDDNELKLKFMINDITINLYYSRKSTLKTKDVKIMIENEIYDFDLNYDTNDKDAIENMFMNIFEKKYNLEYNNKLANKCITYINEVKSKLNNTISIIGGGVYGCLVGIELSNSYNIIINEKNDDILQEATTHSLWRIHKGYHYPRCDITAQLCKNSYDLFLEKYPDCTIKYKHIYCIAKHNSNITSDEYVDFMKRNELSYQKIDKLECFNENTIDSFFTVDERLYNVSKIRKKIYNEFNHNNNIHLNLNSNIENINNTYCRTILTSYWNNNNIITNDNIYEYQICEVVMIKLPEVCKNFSITIMDGPFLSLNPLDDIFGLYDVENTIIYKENTSKFKVPDLYKNIINKGLINDFKFSKHKLTLKKFEYFFNVKYEYVGSAYSVRVLKKNVNDSRFYEINELNNNIYSIFSSKVDCSLLLANDLIKKLKMNEKDPERL